MTTWKVKPTRYLIKFLEASFKAGRYPDDFNIIRAIDRLYQLEPEFPNFPTPVFRDYYLDSVSLTRLLEGQDATGSPDSTLVRRIRRSLPRRNNNGRSL